MISTSSISKILFRAAIISLFIFRSTWHSQLNILIFIQKTNVMLSAPFTPDVLRNEFFFQLRDIFVIIHCASFLIWRFYDEHNFSVIYIELL